MSEIIITKGLWRVYNSGDNRVNALKDVNISIYSNKLTILKGRSGSGKTTLMNLMGILDKPTKGEIYFNNEDVTSLSEGKRDEIRRRNIGFIFQSIALIYTMSAFENVEFGLRIAGYKAAERKNRVEECLEMVGLEKRAGHRPYELSGGEQQRVAIARAIAHRPSVIFADEPTAELDTHNGLQIVKLFKSLVDGQGATVVMTTHDPGMMDVADRIFTLEDGEIVDER